MPNPLTLKQRLAALAVSPSTPTGPYGPEPPKSPGAKRRGFLNPSWMKRPQTDGHTEEQHAQDRMQQVMSRMIYQAGVDFETRPMVVLNASALPDPREVSYDILLARILSYLNLYVEADYTVIFFAAGARHNPGWNWVFKAYRALNRKYRKNLKKLFIVHSNFFTKMLFSLAGAIISPKFFRKISYIDTLSELACYVPLTQIDIPAAVYQENMKYERQVQLPVPTRASIFAVPLEELMGFDGEKGGIPRVVKDCIQFLHETGLEEEGLFRRSPNSMLLKQVCDAYDRGHVVSLETLGDAHLAAVLIKKYLRDLPEPVFTEKLYPLIYRCPPPNNDPNDLGAMMHIRNVILPELPRCAYILISHVLHLMHEVSLRAASNRMDAHNLAIVLCPNLVSSSNPIRDVMMCALSATPAPFPPPTSSAPSTPTEGRTTLGMVIKFCIQRYYEVFDEVEDRSEAIAPLSSPDELVSTSSSRSTSPQPTRFSAFLEDDDHEEIDDEMLVMPLGPAVAGGANHFSQSPPSAWNSSQPSFKPRHRNTLSKSSSSSGLRSTGSVTDVGHANINPLGTIGKAKSMISIEKGSGGTRRGSISVGRGTSKKSVGSGVEAIGITASGFFAAPESAPPVPSLRSGPSS